MKKHDVIRLLCLLCALVMLSGAAFAAENPLSAFYQKGDMVKQLHEDTIHFETRKLFHDGTGCYVTLVWMEDPGRQIRKFTAPFEEAILKPEAIVAEADGVLAFNGSGFVSPLYPEIPDNYPGSSPDYYYTPLGSLTVTDGEILRNLTGVPFYGLTLQADGLHMHAGEDIEEILPQGVQQTWSFYEGCTIWQNGENLLDEEWDFAKRKAIRNMMAKLDDHTYLFLVATSTKGMTLMTARDYILAHYQPEWIYNLDGGPSATLMTRIRKTWKVIYGGSVKVTDTMVMTR